MRWVLDLDLVFHCPIDCRRHDEVEVSPVTAVGREERRVGMVYDERAAVCEATQILDLRGDERAVRVQRTLILLDGGDAAGRVSR